MLRGDFGSAIGAEACSGGHRCTAGVTGLSRVLDRWCRDGAHGRRLSDWIARRCVSHSSAEFSDTLAQPTTDLGEFSRPEHDQDDGQDDDEMDRLEQTFEHVLPPVPDCHLYFRQVEAYRTESDETIRQIAYGFILVV